MKRAGRGAMVAALLLAGQAVAMEDEGGGMDTMLVGTWQAEALLPDGRDAALRLDLDGQHRFAGTVTVDGEVEWQYAGRWQLEGNRIRWQHEGGPRPLPPGMRSDSDTLASIDGAQMVLVHGRSGERVAWRRDP